MRQPVIAQTLRATLCNVDDVARRARLWIPALAHATLAQ